MQIYIFSSVSRSLTIRIKDLLKYGNIFFDLCKLHFKYICVFNFVGFVFPNMVTIKKMMHAIFD